MSGENCSASPRDLLSQSEGFSSQVALCRPGFPTTSLPGSCVRAMLLQPCLTLCDIMDCSPPGSSVHGILQARKLEWVAMPSSRESSWPKDRTWVLSFKFPALQGGFFTTTATWLSPNMPTLKIRSSGPSSKGGDDPGELRDFSSSSKETKQVSHPFPAGGWQFP